MMKSANRSLFVVLVTILTIFTIFLVSQFSIADESTSQSSASGAQDSKNIYRNVNDDGVVEFTDQNYNNSKKIKLKSTNTFKAAKKKIVAPIRNTEKEHGTATSHNSASKYSQIAISSPSAEQQIYNNANVLSVSISISPGLDASAGDKVELYYDGRSQGKQQSTVFNLKKVYRGQHRLQAKIIDKNGTVLKISKPIQFVVHQYSALFKKNLKKKTKANP